MDLRAARWGWAAVIGGALAYDVELERRNLDRRRQGLEELGLLSDAARTAGGWTVVAVIVGHFAGLLGRADPFRLVGAGARWLHARRRPRPYPGAHIP